jgi:hypothetical protein
MADQMAPGFSDPGQRYHAPTSKPGRSRHARPAYCASLLCAPAVFHDGWRALAIKP